MKEENKRLKRTAERQQGLLKKYLRMYLSTTFKIEQLDHQMIAIKMQIEDSGDFGSRETFIDLFDSIKGNLIFKLIILFVIQSQDFDL